MSSMKSTLRSTSACSLKQSLWLYFCMGILIGATLGCAVAFMFALCSFGTTYQFYYYNERVYQIHLPQVEPGFHVIEGKSYSQPLKLPPPQVNIDTTSQGVPWYDFTQLSNAHNHIRGTPISDIAVVLVSGYKCQLLGEGQQEAILDTWGGSVTIFLILDSKCAISNLWKEIALRRNLTIYSYTYSQNDVSVYKMMYKLNQRLEVQHKWIVFISPHTFVNVLRFHVLLREFSSSDNHIFGTVLSDEGDKPSRRYCQTKPSLVLSRVALKNLVDTGSSCFQSHKEMTDNIIFTVGQCTVESLGIDCSSELSMLSNFHEQTLESTDELDLKHLENYVTVHPMISAYGLYRLHQYFTILEYNSTLQKLDHLAADTRRLASKIEHLNTKTSYTPIRKSDYPLQEDSSDDLYKVNSWVYFNSFNMYVDENMTPVKSFSLYKSKLDSVLLETLRLANIDHPTPLVFHQIINGYFLHCQEGTKYILDIQLKELYNPYVTLQRRFSLLRPFRLDFVQLPSKNSIDEVVHIIVPVNNVGDRLKTFFQMYEKLEDLGHYHLVLVVYSQKDVEDCKTLVTQYHKLYPSSRVTLVEAKGKFARARALDTGAASLNDNDLMFFCDVDMDVADEFFGRCQRNTVRNERVYYPEVFKMYNMKYVYKFKSKPLVFDISRKHGHWGYYAFGMLCIYKSDYIKAGGLDTTYLGWGGEDVEFYQRILKRGYHVLRAPEPGLVHHWHQKKCHLTDRSKQIQCISSQTEILADRRELGKYVYELEKNKSHLFCI